MPGEEELRTSLARTAEIAELGFKSKFEVADAGDWLEIIKDIVAFANSGGGTILIGVNDAGTPSGADVAGVLAIDPADLTNRIHKYNNTHFLGFEFIECESRSTHWLAICDSATGKKPAWPSGALPLGLTEHPIAPAYYAVPIDTRHLSVRKRWCTKSMPSSQLEKPLTHTKFFAYGAFILLRTTSSSVTHRTMQRRDTAKRSSTGGSEV